MDVNKEYERWLASATADVDVAAELKTMNDTKIEDAFYRDLAFGTGGLRGVIGAGTNRMNIYTVAKASQGLADYLKKNFAEPSVAIDGCMRRKNMNVILLSGGSGKRLWPLSNDVRSKQFIKLFKNNDEYESMVQRVYRQITTVDADAKITIATSKSQASAIKNQLGEKASICVEPCRRDTFPAIALAAAYLHDELGVAENEAVVVCPVDPYVDNTYYEAVKTLQELAEQGGANLTLMGIEPTYPSEKYGYIIPESGENVSKVKEFKEKPDVETAKKYLAQSALWNAGIFAFKLGYGTFQHCYSRASRLGAGRHLCG